MSRRHIASIPEMMISHQKSVFRAIARSTSFPPSLPVIMDQANRGDVSGARRVLRVMARDSFPLEQIRCSEQGAERTMI